MELVLVLFLKYEFTKLSDDNNKYISNYIFELVN